MKKILIIGGLILIFLIGIFIVPKWINKKAAESKAHYDNVEKEANKKADEVLGDKLGITGGNAGFGGKYSQHARDNANKAMMRSNKYMDDMEAEEEEEED